MNIVWPEWVQVDERMGWFHDWDRKKSFPVFYYGPVRFYLERETKEGFIMTLRL